MRPSEPCTGRSAQLGVLMTIKSWGKGDPIVVYLISIMGYSELVRGMIRACSGV
jgi:hypothetical protein